MTISVSKGHNWAKIRQDAKGAIDTQAETARAKVMTARHGQDYVYGEKFREAQAYFAPGANQSPDLYPFLSAEAQIEGTSLGEEANRIMSTRQILHQHLATIEIVRRTAKKKVDAAQNKIAEINLIVEQTVYPLPPKPLSN